jgi:DNA invertase Pin-like site-specific DNA recombinase
LFQPALHRQDLRKALDVLAAGDRLLVCRLDCLARPTLDLLKMLDAFGKESWISFRCEPRSLMVLL